MSRPCLKVSKFLTGNGKNHICYFCEDIVVCAQKGDNKAECKCQTVLAYCFCNACNDPLNDVKGIVAYCCGDECPSLIDDDEDDSFSYNQ